MIVFHRFLIGSAIVFCALFAVWELNAYRSDSDGTRLALGVAFGVITLALAYYLKNLRRFLGGGGGRR